MAGNRILTVSLNPSLDLTCEVDRFVFGDICRVRGRQVHPGGKGLNVCRMVARLGVRCRAVAFLGGRTGGEVARLLRREGVSFAAVPVRGETRTIHNFTERCGPRVLRINEPGPRVSRSEWRSFLCVLRRQAVASGGIACLSGSVPAGLPVSSYRTLIRILKNTSSLVALDADGACVRSALAARPHLIKPNLWELERIVGCRLRSASAIQSACVNLQRAGVAMVLLTLGENGAILFSSDGILCAVPPRVKGRCPVGCGDAFLAGFLVGISEGRALDACLGLAAACGAAKARLPGTEMPDAAAVASLLPRVRTASVRKVPAEMVSRLQERAPGACHFA